MFSSYFCFCERANFSVYWTSRGPISRFIGPPEGQFLGLLDSQRANFLVYWTHRGPISSFIGLPESQFLRFLSLCTGNEPHARSGVCLPVRRRGKSDGSYGPLRGSWGGAGSPSQRSGQHTRCRPCVAPQPRLRRGTPQEPGAPATPYVCRPVSNLPAWGRYQRPPYTVRRGRPWTALTAPKAPSGCVGHA